MDLATALLYFPVFASFGTLAGVIVVSRYPDRRFSAPLARLTLVLCAGFMLWAGWVTYESRHVSTLYWMCAVISAGGGLLVGGTVLFGSNNTVLWFIEQVVEHMRRGA